jgi:competence protein ComEC
LPGADGPAGDAGEEETGERIDLRLVPVAAALWAGALLGLGVPLRGALMVCVVSAAVAATVCRRRRRLRGAAAIAVLCLAAGTVAGASRSAVVHDGPVARLADQGAHVQVEATVVDDPRLRGSVSGGDESGPNRPYVLTRLRIDQISGRGEAYRVRTPVFAVASDPSWTTLRPGQRLRVSGGLAAAGGGDVAAFFRVRGDPELLGRAGAVARTTEPVREGLRAAVTAVPGSHRALIPGMVVGDESMMDAELREAMRVTGLTHLTAVSGTHVGIVLLAVLGLARLAGARGYVLPVLALVSLVGFVLLVRPAPSVLRAAVMGSVAVAGLLLAGRRRALPALAAAVGVLILVDPWLARSLGFALSVSATAGILVLVPGWERSMAWLPRPLALAVAVPIAAQLACTPVLLAAFGQFSVASVPANMLVAPAVAPAMVLGLAAAVVSPVWAPAAGALAWLAGVPAWWITTVARWFARQPGAEFSWPEGTAGAVIGVVLGVAGMAVLPVILRRPVVSFAVSVVLVTVLLRAVPTPGWPPPGWIIAMCDVGQGDAIVLRAGERAAVVVDTGPEPLAVRHCLDSLRVTQVPLLVLTHFHAYHVDGLPGVLAGRSVGTAIVSPLQEPAVNAGQVAEWLADAGVPVREAAVGERWSAGEGLWFEILWPRRLIVSAESDANNASVVLAARVSGVDILLTGDVEPLAQRAILAAVPDLRTRVLKVAHHGSRHQDERFLAGLGAELAIIGVGENTHGHPSDEVLDAFDTAGVEVRRTDLDGTFAVILTPGHTLATVTKK